MSGLGSLLSYEESKKMTEEQQGPTLSVRLGSCLSYGESNKMTEERQGPTLGVRLRDALAL